MDSNTNARMSEAPKGAPKAGQEGSAMTQHPTVAEFFSLNPEARVAFVIKRRGSYLMNDPGRGLRGTKDVRCALAWATDAQAAQWIVHAEQSSQQASAFLGERVQIVEIIHPAR